MIAYCLRYIRTEYAKRIRKDYEAGRIKERRCDLREYDLRITPPNIKHYHNGTERQLHSGEGGSEWSS